MEIPQALDRRRFLSLSAFASLGLAAGVRAAPPGSANADSCVRIVLNRWIVHFDTFDPKPAQPAAIRAEFATIRTSVPGIHVGEHLPRLARLANHWAVLRTVGFDGRL